MGGQGTFATGKSVPYTYKTVGVVDGVKVLEGINNGVMPCGLSALGSAFLKKGSC